MKNSSIIHNLLALSLGGVVGCLLNLTGRTGVANIFFAPFGSLYLRVLQFVALPMIFCLVTDSIMSFPDVRKIISLSVETICTNIASAIFVGVVCCFVTVCFVAKGYLSLIPTIATQIHGFVASNYMDGLMNLVPSNVSGRFLQENLLVIFASSVLLGFLMARQRAKLGYLSDFLSSLNLILKHVIDIVMRFAPIGVFAITANTFASNDLSVFKSLFGLLLLTFVIAVLCTTFSIIITALLAKRSFLSCLRAEASAIFFGFATSSSTACIPLVQDAAAEFGCKRETSAFVIPLSKMLMKPGGLMDTYCAIAFVIVASGQTLPLPMWGYMILVSIVFSLIVPAIPMGGVFIVPIAVAHMGLEAPEHLVALLFTAYLFLDMFGTGMTCAIDALSAIAVDKLESCRAVRRAK